MAGSSAESANLDPYAKPKPGKKVYVLLTTLKLV